MSDKIGEQSVVLDDARIIKDPDGFFALGISQKGYLQKQIDITPSGSEEEKKVLIDQLSNLKDLVGIKVEGLDKERTVSIGFTHPDGKRETITYSSASK